MDHTLWELLIKTALLGTERAPLPDVLVRQAAALGFSAEEEPAGRLLDLLASGQLQRKAGFPLHTVAQPSLPAETLPPPPFIARTGAFLEQILAGVYPGVLPELLALLQRTGGEIPPESLPALLDRAARDPVFFARIQPALGRRAVWLAAQNPAWNALLPAGDEIWDTGKAAERLRWLREARASRPLVALARLETSWRSERPEHKTMFLQALGTRLSTLDEDFLEKILTGDKNREVRRAAFDLLMQIPGSQRRTSLATFFQERLSGVFSAASPQRFLEKRLPDLSEPPCVWLAALLEPADVGRWRPAIVCLLMENLPLSAVTEGASAAPAAFLEQLAEKPAFAEWLSALSVAAGREKNAEWSEAILLALAGRPADAPVFPLAIAPLLDALPLERRTASLCRLLQRPEALAAPADPLVNGLLQARQPWSAGVLEAFATLLGRSPYPQPWHRELLTDAAHRCAPAEGSRVLAWLDGERQPGWRVEIAQFSDVLRFRSRMRAAFEEGHRL